MPTLNLYNPQRSAILGRRSRTGLLLPEAAMRIRPVPPKYVPPTTPTPIPVTPKPITATGGDGSDSTPDDSFDPNTMEPGEMDPASLKGPAKAGALAIGTAILGGAPIGPALAAYGIVRGGQYALVNSLYKNVVKPYAVDPIKGALGLTAPPEAPSPAGWESSHFGSEPGPTTSIPEAPAISSVAGWDAPHFGSGIQGEEASMNFSGYDKAPGTIAEGPATGMPETIGTGALGRGPGYGMSTEGIAGPATEGPANAMDRSESFNAKDADWDSAISNSLNEDPGWTGGFGNEGSMGNNDNSNAGAGGWG